MNTRTIAGLGMTLLAIGLLTIYFLDVDFPTSPTKKAPPSEQASPLTPASLDENRGPAEVDKFLANYNATYRSLWTDAAVASWAFAANQTSALAATETNARRRLHDYTGSGAVVNQLRQFRGRLDLNQLQDRQIEKAWQLAAHYPASSAEESLLLHDLEAALADSLASITYSWEKVEVAGKHQTLAELSAQFSAATEANERLVVWEAAQTLGLKTKDHLVQVRDLRNHLARKMGYSSYFGLTADQYGMSSEELLQLTDNLVTGLSPLYQQLHCNLKHELAVKFDAQVPRLIPAHWVPALDGLDWSLPGMAHLAPSQVDSVFLGVQPQWILEQAESFHTSLGFAPLPLGFWGRSDLYPLADDGERVKSSQAQAWHLDLDQDIRAMMNVRADFTSYGESHRIMAELYYLLTFSREEVPASLRHGANPAFVKGIGNLMKLAGTGTAALLDTGLMSPGQTPEQVDLLLRRAMNGSLLNLSLLGGTLTHWEFDLYEKDLPRHLFNTRWWEYAAKFQGIEAVVGRGEMDCAPAIRSDIILNPISGLHEGLGLVIAHQLHRYICQHILNEDVRLANYRGQKAVGLYLQSIMQLGATRDWAQIMRESTGEDLSAEAILAYYQPLTDWLATRNAETEVDFSLVAETSAP